MTTRSRRKVYPRFVALEIILVAAFAIASYLIAEHVAHAALAVFLAGAASDRVLILVLRHRNKPLLPKITVSRKPARKPAGRRS